MTKNDEIQVGAKGVVFYFTIKHPITKEVVVISVSDTITIYFKPPNATKFAKTGSLYSDGSDGIVKYTTASADDLYTGGKWRVQAVVDFSNGDRIPTSIEEFFVNGNL